MNYNKNKYNKIKHQMILKLKSFNNLILEFRKILHFKLNFGFYFGFSNKLRIRKLREILEYQNEKQMWKSI